MSKLSNIIETESILFDRNRLRDGFATAAMSGLLSDSHTVSMTAADIARVSYETADEMLKARRS